LEGVTHLSSKGEAAQMRLPTTMDGWESPIRGLVTWRRLRRPQTKVTGGPSEANPKPPARQKRGKVLRGKRGKKGLTAQ